MRYPHFVKQHAIEDLSAAGGGDTLLDLDTVNNLSFDDMEEAVGFVVPPEGIYRLQMDKATMEKYEAKDPKNAGQKIKKGRISHYYSILEVLELVKSDEQHPPIGGKFSERFQLNENGLKYWKKKTKDILGDVGTNLTVSAVLQEASTGVYTFKARVKHKETEGEGANAGKKFTNIQVQILSVDPKAELEGGEKGGEELKV